jgi:hypothetical protein
MLSRMASAKSPRTLPATKALCQTVTTPGLNRILLDWTVWKLIVVAGEPARRLFLLAILAGTSAGSLSVEAARKLLALIGLLAGTQRVVNPLVPGQIVDLRRWHLLLGAAMSCCSFSEASHDSHPWQLSGELACGLDR